MHAHRLYQAVAIAVAVGIAVSVLLRPTVALISAGGLAFAALLSLPLLAWRARLALPARPRSAQLWLNRTWLGLVVLFGAVLAVPVWLGARFGEQFDAMSAKRAAAQVVGVAIAFASIEIAKIFDMGDFIDRLIGYHSYRYLMAALKPQFDDQNPPGPLPVMVSVDDTTKPSTIWLDTFASNLSWSHEDRCIRAKRLASDLDRELRSQVDSSFELAGSDVVGMTSAAAVARRLVIYGPLIDRSLSDKTVVFGHGEADNGNPD